MAMEDDVMQTHGAGLISADERLKFAEAIAVARGRAVDPDELSAVLEWVTRARVNIVLTEAVLDGLVSVCIKNGTPVFRGRPTS